MDGLVVLGGFAVAGILFVTFIIWLFVSGPSKETIARNREEYEEKRQEAIKQKQAQQDERRNRQKRKQLPIPPLEMEAAPFEASEDSLWGFGWKEDEITGHRELLAYGMGMDTDDEPVGLKVFYTPPDTGRGVWWLGLVYEGRSLRGKLTTLYLLIDGERYQTYIGGQGHQRTKSADFFLTDPAILRALCHASEVKYAFADERGELFPGALEGFRRLGQLLYASEQEINSTM